MNIPLEPNSSNRLRAASGRTKVCFWRSSQKDVNSFKLRKGLSHPGHHPESTLRNPMLRIPMMFVFMPWCLKKMILI